MNCLLFTSLPEYLLITETPVSPESAVVLLLLFVCAWVTRIVMAHERPGGAVDMAGMVAFISALYGLNQLKNAINSKPPSA